ncbi:dienelactone hydrolase family protein [bacterium]|nr:dienelactone hydrolase family protein [bacterium]
MSDSTLPEPFQVESVISQRDDFPEFHDYAVLSPKSMEPGREYPLVLFLHGAGERGDDLSKVLAHFPILMATTYRDEFPAFVIIPQCEEDKFWARIHWRDPESPMAEEPGSMMKMVMQILEEVLDHHPIDRRRIYLTGLSMGGFGSWELAIRLPEMFAALVPICGGGDPKRVINLRSLPIWSFHSADDNVVDVEHSRRLVRALCEAGGDPKYTEYEDAGHHSWVPAYNPGTGLLKWMFAQQKI